MAEYIERDMFLKIISHKPSSPTTDREDRLINYCISAVKNFPAADVVSVVRCKDCRYAYDSVGGWCCSHGICVDCVVREDFFCADGARMDGDGDV